MSIEYITWFMLGLAGAYVLYRNPGKLVFSRNSQGAARRIMVIVLIFLATGPLLLITALLLPSKKLCSSCYTAIRQDETICPVCGAYVPDEQKEPKFIEEQIAENQFSHFSPQVQAVIAKGSREVSLGSGLLLIGILLITLILAIVFIGDGIWMVIVPAGVALAFALAWLWWSYSVPRWRDWALKQPGVSADELQRAAELAALVWPKGHFFERTEFKMRRK